MLVHSCGNTGKRWMKSAHGWEEDSNQSEVIAESMHINQVKRVIELFLKKKFQKELQSLYTNISAAPVSKCSVKESVEWLQISLRGSKECHGYSTLGELVRRLSITNSLWQEGRFQYVMCLTEVIVEKKFNTLSGTSRRNLFNIITALVQRVVDTKESIRQMKRIVFGVMKLMMGYKSFYIGCKQLWFQEIETVREWMRKLNLLSIEPRVDLSLTLTNLPIEVQRNIIGKLTDHRDIESLSRVNKNFQLLCNENDVWKNLCYHHFSQNEIHECETVLERRRQKSLKSEKDETVDKTWRTKYHFMLRRYEQKEEFADPLMFCGRCSILFWQDSGHPCVLDSSTPVHEKISPRKLISLF